MKQFIPLGLCAFLCCSSVFAERGLPDREPQTESNTPGGETFQTFPLPGAKSSISVDEPGVHRSAPEVKSKEDVYVWKIKAIDAPSCIDGNCDFQDLYEQTSKHKSDSGKNNIDIQSFSFGVSNPGAKSALDENLTGPCRPPYLCLEVDLSSSIVSPRDSASGLPTGKRQHKPMTITKPTENMGTHDTKSAIIPGYECDAPEGRDEFKYPLLSGIKCELKEIVVEDPVLTLKARAGTGDQGTGNVGGTGSDERRKGRDGTVKGVTAQESLIVSPRDVASGLPTGKRQHKPMIIRFSPSSNGTDFGIIIEADTDGDGEFEPFVRAPVSSSNSQISGKTKPKEEKPAKKQYIGHVTLMK